MRGLHGQTQVSLVMLTPEEADHICHEIKKLKKAPRGLRELRRTLRELADNPPQRPGQG